MQNRTNNPYPPETTAEHLPIIVHSHLRWDFVWQRPQQILSRLAENHRIAFVEEPQWDESGARLDITEPQQNIVRIIPALPRSFEGDVDGQCAAILPLLQAALREHPLLRGRFAQPIHWFYTPMVAPGFVGKLGASALVYDCMDELANFRFAPPDLRERERFLLTNADVVFTGGYQLFTSKSQHHRNVHFYGCGVEVDHYAKARSPETNVPADVAKLPGPVLGYFGVIDERLDYDLIDTLSRAFDAGSIVMIGPVVKIDPASLPQRPNVHWLGQRDYRDLPAYVKAFDVCLMPFALNDATANINPTKTLEYMAAGKPVISTAVRDVVRNFTPIVQVASSYDEFVELAQAASAAPPPDTIARGIERANAASWDAIVAAMRGHMLSAVRSRASAPASTVTI